MSVLESSPAKQRDWILSVKLKGLILTHTPHFCIPLCFAPINISSSFLLQLLLNRLGTTGKYICHIHTSYIHDMRMKWMWNKSYFFLSFFFFDAQRTEFLTKPLNKISNYCYLANTQHKVFTQIISCSCSCCFFSPTAFTTCIIVCQFVLPLDFFCQQITLNYMHDKF